MQSLKELIYHFPKHLWLEISHQEQELAEKHCQNNSNNVACRNAYVNYLCFNKIISYLDEENKLDSDSFLEHLNYQSRLSIWEFVNGSVVELKQTQIIIIPSESTEIDDFSVPFEWVDIASWAGNYYLAVQMNLEQDESWLRVWGFTTYRSIKKGKKDNIRRTYSLERKDLIENLNVMWVGMELCPEEKPFVASLPTLPPYQVEILLQKLGKLTLHSLRLEVSFEQWAILLAEERWRQQLYQLRLKGKKECQ
ncbi:DUF1822 family protein [Nostoc sp. PA-18-2419]|uniref:DUF1822 family protein n=1 Tax=Nostoc sp. PA-18-2419 TaxID=2575443 RepID=UPI00110A046C|nr:DUF1822 family protein [Nostoc sp. PA-18-2419]